MPLVMSLILKRMARFKMIRHFTIAFAMALIFLFATSAARAELVHLHGSITDGAFITPTFVPDPSNPSGGTIENRDQLGLTGAKFAVRLEFAHSILGRRITDGFSFVSRDGDGNIIGSRLDVSASLTLGGGSTVTFRSFLENAAERLIIENGFLKIDALISGATFSPRFIGATPDDFLRIMSPRIPDSVETVGDLANFLNTTQLFTTGSLPVEFFIESPTGGQQLVSSTLEFEIGSWKNPPQEIPVPGAVWLFLTALMGGYFARRARRTKHAVCAA